MRSIRNRRTAATRSTTGTRLYAVGMGVPGRESVTVMPTSIRSVRSVIRKVFCVLLRKYTTSCHWRRVALMTRETLCRCASRAMPGFMRSVGTDGININLFSVWESVLWRFLLTRRGGLNLYSRFSVERAWGHTHKNRKSNGGLPRLSKNRFPLVYSIFYGAAVFDFRSIFSNEIKETG